MNTGQPTQDEKDLVERNQQINQTSDNSNSDKSSTPTNPTDTSNNPGPPTISQKDQEQDIPIKTDSTDSTPPANTPTDSPTSPTPPSANSTPTPPANPAASSVPTPPVQEDRIPLQQPSENNVGVGTPNIGVEKSSPDNQNKPSDDQPKSPDENQANNKPESLEPIDNTSKTNQAPLENTIEVENLTYEPAPPQPPAQPTPSKPSVAPPPQPPIPAKPEMPQVKNYQDPQDQKPNQPQPPIKAPGSSASLVALILVALVLGSASGFFGFRYWDNLKTSASVQTTPSASSTPSLDVSTWSSYSSTLYNFTLKYPSAWKTSSTDPQAESLVFAANQESLSSEPTSFKIEISFQNLNDQTLKQWVEANSTTTGEKKAAKEITVSNKTAYQQELTKSGTKVATYIERPNKVMIVTYSAPEDKFGEGGEWYNNLINSIQLD